MNPNSKNIPISEPLKEDLKKLYTGLTGKVHSYGERIITRLKAVERDSYKTSSRMKILETRLNNFIQDSLKKSTVEDRAEATPKNVKRQIIFDALLAAKKACENDEKLCDGCPLDPGEGTICLEYRQISRTDAHRLADWAANMGVQMKEVTCSGHGYALGCGDGDDC